MAKKKAATKVSRKPAQRVAEKPIRGAFNITTYQGPVRVNGWVLGLFGVDNRWGAREFTVTHIPTGHAIGFTRTRAKALEMQREFHESPVPWAFTNPKPMPRRTITWAKKAIAKYMSPAGSK